MKKGEIYEGVVTSVEFPNKALVQVDEEVCQVKNAIPGQKISFRVTKKRSGRAEGLLKEVLENSPIETNPNVCPHFRACGGCTYQSVEYAEQLKIKEAQVKAMMDRVVSEYEFQPITGSPLVEDYRNKVEFTFGDEYKDGPLSLGMHKIGSFYDIVHVKDCTIMDADFRLILTATRDWCANKNLPFYHSMQHVGYLRHLLVRKAIKTGQILVDIITSTQMDGNLQEYAAMLAKLQEDGRFKGTLVGVLHTSNDALADAVINEGTELLWGRDFIEEELLGLTFKITPFSFFQTNSLGAEVLYSKVREYVGDCTNKVVFDLYSGTGTIAQIVAPVATKVVGVEIIEEAVVAARENARRNGLSNCEFLAGDVLKVVDELTDKPDTIILDPPRDGIHPKAIEKIINFGVNRIVYVSCKPTSLARDLEIFTARGYKVEKIGCVDMFPGTVHVETVCLLSRKAPV